MLVQANSSATRVLDVLEGIARHQPVGLTALAKAIGENKSAVQRAIVTLAKRGWIAEAPGSATRWELTPYILSVASMGQDSNDWNRRARAMTEQLRDELRETVFISIPAFRHFVVLHSAESREALRVTVTIGRTAPPRGSATSKAMLPFLSAERQVEMLGEEPDEKMRESFARVRERGYAVNKIVGATTVAAAILGHDGFATAALVVAAPDERLPPGDCMKVGVILRDAARRLSGGMGQR